MIEVTLRNYLSDNMDIPVLMEHPQTSVKKYILLQLADASIVNHIDMATIFVNVYADSLYEAAELRDKVKELLLNAIFITGIAKSSLGQDQAATDSANHLYQYSLTFNFYYYREETK